MITLRYKVEYYAHDICSYCIEKGIVSAIDYNDMMNKLNEYYGQENILTVSFYELYNLMCDADIRETLNSDSEEDEEY